MATASWSLQRLSPSRRPGKKKPPASSSAHRDGVAGLHGVCPGHTYTIATSAALQWHRCCRRERQPPLRCDELGARVSRPAAHWDASSTRRFPQRFEDLEASTPAAASPTSRTQPFYKRIETLLHSGITAGCTATPYCPSDNVSRGQMALFIAAPSPAAAPHVPRAARGRDPYVCGPGGTRSSPTCRRPTRPAAASTTSRRRTSRRAALRRRTADDNVTRLQMASFMAKAIVAPLGGPGVPLTYGPDRSPGFSYSCNTGSSEHLLHRRAGHEYLLQARPLPLGEGLHHRLRRRRSTVRTTR